MIYVWFFLTLIIIIKAGDLFIDSSIWIARAFKVPEFITGAVIVSLCTVLPEAVISAGASAEHDAGLAFGTSAGAAVFNIALILSLCMLFSPAKLRFTKGLKRSCIVIALLCASVIVMLQRAGGLSRRAGASLVLFAVLYLLSGARNSKSAAVVCFAKNRLWIKAAVLTASGAAICLSSHILVLCSRQIAASLHIPTMLTGLTLTAAGAALPELITCMAAIKKGAAEIAIGNALGSAILNLCLVTGAAAAVNPIHVSLPGAFFTLCAALCCAIYLYFCFSRKSRRLYRFDGIFLLALYCAFISASAIMFSSR